MGTVGLDELDRRIMHGLLVAPRASFRELAAVIGAPERAVARRYRALADTAGLRIVGRHAEDRPGWTSWLVRVRTTPDTAVPLAEALAARSDTMWVRLGSGGMEVTCGIHAPGGARGGGGVLLDRLSSGVRVVAMSAHMVLQVFSPLVWRRLAGALSADEVAALAAGAASVAEPEPSDGESLDLDADDERLIELLSVDARASAAHLADQTGWHESTVRRRLAQLTASGRVTFDLDIDEEALGLGVSAQLWLTVDPGALEATGRKIAGHLEASFVAAVTGPTNVVVGAACRSAEHLYQYLTDGLGRIPAIRAVETVPMVQVYKRHASLAPSARSRTA